MARLTKRTVDSAKAEGAEAFLWCGATPGFGIRVYQSGRKIFIVQVRVGKQTRRIKIGAYGPYTVEQAREVANEHIRAVAEGRDPQREKSARREAVTVAQLCASYLEAAEAGLVYTRFGKPKSPSTVGFDHGRISRHIVPLIGGIPAHELRPSDVQRMAENIAAKKTAGTFLGKPRGKAVVTGGAGTAARVVGLLGGIYSWAEKRAKVPGPNPVRNIETARGMAKDRVLGDAELRALGIQLDAQHGDRPMAAAAVRLIALTGLRREEACGLKWAEIDELGHCIRLSDTKTGRSIRPIGRPAMRLLREQPKVSEVWVFPNSTNKGRAELKKLIANIFDAAGLTDARSHDLRRTFATIAADEGYSDSTIGELLGHSQRTVTSRHYIRRPDSALVAAADRVSQRVDVALRGKSAQVEVLASRSSQPKTA